MLRVRMPTSLRVSAPEALCRRRGQTPLASQRASATDRHGPELSTLLRAQALARTLPLDPFTMVNRQEPVGLTDYRIGGHQTCSARRQLPANLRGKRPLPIFGVPQTAPSMLRDATGRLR